MQVVEQVGGSFLLQETKPVALHGALTIITSGSDKGWLLVSLSPSDSSLSCETNAGFVRFQMDLEIALRFAGTLLLLASVHVPELREDRSADVGELDIAGRPGQKVMTWTSVKDSPDVKIAVEDGSVELRLRSALAVAMAFRIMRHAGQVSAQPDQGV